MAPKACTTSPLPLGYRLVLSWEGDTRPHHDTRPHPALECHEKAPETEPTPEHTPIPIIQDWARFLHTHTHGEFAALALLHNDRSCPPCMDVSGAALIRPSKINHYVFGSWQDTLDVHECLEGIFRLLQLDPTISLMQQPEIDQIRCLGEAPTRWTRTRHFPPAGDPAHTSIPTCYGPWHVTFYVCQLYWSIIDPLEEDLPKPPRMQFRLHIALRESYSPPAISRYRHSRLIETP